MIQALGAIAGLAGKGLDAWISSKNAAKNIKYQKQFAQHGISWKVADAKAAGLHPLAALGANTTSFSPVSVGSNFGEAGQDISRAIQATQNSAERESGAQGMLAKLQIQRAGLENQILASQLAKMNQPAQPPGAPTTIEQRLLDGQGNAPLNSKINEKPLERMGTMPGDPSKEAGAVASTGFLKTPTGMEPVKSKDATDRLEDDTIGNLTWSLKNRLYPFLGFNQRPPPLTEDMKKKGQKWVFNPIMMEYQKMKPRLGGWVHW